MGWTRKFINRASLGTFLHPLLPPSPPLLPFCSLKFLTFFYAPIVIPPKTPMENSLITTRRQRNSTKTQERRQATPKEKKLIHLLANLGCSLVRYDYKHSTTKGVIPPDERKHLAEWHYLRLQQIRRVERSLEPVATLKRVYYKSILSPRDLKSLKLLWVDDEGKNRVKRVDPDLDLVLTEALDRGDTLKQIFYTIEVKERLFSPTPAGGPVPFWVQEWENSDYDINFFPPSFPAWASIVDD